MAETGVVMKGGTSGNRFDSLAPVPSSGKDQPVLDTSSDKSYPDVQYPDHPNRNPYQEATPDFLPNCGTIPESSTDVEDQNDGRNRGN